MYITADVVCSWLLLLLLTILLDPAQIRFSSPQTASKFGRLGGVVVMVSDL